MPNSSPSALWLVGRCFGPADPALADVGLCGSCRLLFVFTSHVHSSSLQLMRPTITLPGGVARSAICPPQEDTATGRSAGPDCAPWSNKPTAGLGSPTRVGDAQESAVGDCTICCVVGCRRRTVLSASPLVLLGRFLFALRVPAEARP